MATPKLPVSSGHVFHERLNGLLAEAGFNAWIEGLCQPYYAKSGRPGIPPGVYFRMLLVGYLEGIGGNWLPAGDRVAVQRLAVASESPRHSDESGLP
ncbi:MAG: hypothetical protein ACK5V1_02465 [Planctomycetaceae bacterium]